jgi:aryl-alcohol dehydrogenase-like predicted oxidoreductase
METRLLGSSGLEVPVYIFGAWAAGGWAWGGTDAGEACQAIRASLDYGANAFDTAPVYGFGDSETLLGKALDGVPRSSYLLLTKFGRDWETTRGAFHFDSQDNQGKPVRGMRDASVDAVIRSCEQSLRRLGTDYIDLFQIHWPDPTTPVDETMEALERLRVQGKIRAGGVSNYSVGEMEQALTCFPIASNQIPYSMVRREAQRAILPYCLQKNLGVLVYSPLQRGLLTGKIRPGHSFAGGETRPRSVYFKEPNLTSVQLLLDGLRPLAESKGCTLGQLVLQWTIRQEGITAALVGARNAVQVRENMRALEVVLAPDEMQWIEDRLSGLVIEEV